MLSDYRASPWLHFGSEPSFYGDPISQTLFTESLAFLEALTNRFVEAEAWPQLLPNELRQALEQHNHHAQLEGRLPKAETVTLMHIQALSKRRLLAFEETGWHLTHYDHLVRYIDQLINHAITIAGTKEEQTNLTRPVHKEPSTEFSPSMMTLADTHLLPDTTYLSKDVPAHK